MSKPKYVKDTVETFSNTGADFAQKSYDRVLGATKEQVEKASVQAFKTYEEISKLSKENLEAYVAASSVVAKGFETMGKAWLAFTQDAMESSAEAAKALIGAKTLREAADLQADWAKSAFDKFVAEGTKMSELSVKVANQAFEPINARVNVAVEKLVKPIAA